MKNLDRIASDLFNKIRGRFPNVTIGDDTGNITNIPTDARFYDFSYFNNGEDLGSVSVSLDEDTGVVVIVSKDLVDGRPEDVQDGWYGFLRELRMFSKKRLLNFDVRDINKKQLNKKDYNFLAQNRPGEDQMSESKMYGNKNTSYQKIGNARLAIKHSTPIAVENANSRTQKIKAIYVESPEGERFRYPYTHLSGARAMARHVSEGGNAYDDFGKYISGLSEEISKLRKFNQYLGRSAVMAETLGGYTDVVKARVTEVKKEIQNLQKESYYTEAVAGFSPAIVEDVPTDVAENWIDQLTIKQFNEELADVFPFIYRLVGESTKARELAFEDFTDDDEEPEEAPAKKSAVSKAPREENELERGFEKMMGQFADMGSSDVDTDENYPDGMDQSQLDGDGEVEDAVNHGISEITYAIKNDEGILASLQEFKDEAIANGSQGTIKDVADDIIELASEMAREVLSGQFGDSAEEAAHDSVFNFAKKQLAAKFNQLSAQGETSAEPTKQKTPIGEFILSYFDRDVGKFPKGKTAVLTAVQKEYGDEYVKPSMQFIKKITGKMDEFMPQGSDEKLGEKYKAPTSGEFEDAIDTPEADDVPVTVHWEVDDWGVGIDIHVVDVHGDEINVSPQDEARFKQKVQDDGQDDADGYGDAQMHARQDDESVSEKYKAPQSGEIQSYIDTAQADDFPVVVHWEANDRDYDIYVTDQKGNEVNVSPQDEARFRDEIESEMRDQSDGYGDDQMHAKQDRDYERGMESAGNDTEAAAPGDDFISRLRELSGLLSKS
jgi:hypothetical protein